MEKFKHGRPTNFAPLYDVEALDADGILDHLVAIGVDAETGKAIARKKQQQYEKQRQRHREQWAQSDKEDWCARKGVSAGDYRPVSD